ncbi:hypothetical protein KUCAC02_004441 [Chaenocephalus aceratus]|uniref:Uncharacterized protein n=1 Tax=Chaenocephalus aceratus TaxID=36190 RepID=A0ACB9X045_CHAAC|nr:hypothetical protein KUCAC02_004441 [Chaenocephalus aceratus]
MEHNDMIAEAFSLQDNYYTSTMQRVITPDSECAPHSALLLQQPNQEPFEQLCPMFQYFLEEKPDSLKRLF